MKRCCARVLLASLALALGLVGCGHMGIGEVRPIPRDEDTFALVPAKSGAPHKPDALPAPEVPHHPYMAPHGASSMHVDPFTTNTYAWPGPLGITPQVADNTGLEHFTGPFCSSCRAVSGSRDTFPQGGIGTVLLGDRRSAASS